MTTPLITEPGPEIHVIWYGDRTGEKYRGWWDQTMIEDLLSNKMWRTGYTFTHHEGIQSIPIIAGAIVVVPARLWAGAEDQINAFLQRFEFVILILTGDEEASFKVESIIHSNMNVWVMSPRHPRHDSYTKIGSGYTPHTESVIAGAPEKSNDWFFSGQANHERRTECIDQLQGQMRWSKCLGRFISTGGFTQGVPTEEYIDNMVTAKVAPCPAGRHTPDTFRLFEALEMGCVPIADNLAAEDEDSDFDYWGWFFNTEPPFPRIRNYCDLPHMIEVSVDQYPVLNNRVFAWWQRQKYDMTHHLVDQIIELSGIKPSVSKITVLIPSSKLNSHPSTSIIEKTIDDIKVHLPDSDIIIMMDNPHPDDQTPSNNYQEYKRRLLWLCNYKWNNVLPVIYEQYLHQSGKMFLTLPMVKTPLVLFVEHDAPLTPDRFIEWSGLIDCIESGHANLIRFSHESHVLDEHAYLFSADVEQVCGVGLRKTWQYSGRPHLASTAWYRDVLNKWFRPESKAFLEHVLYGALVETYNKEGIMGWNLWKTWMYHPEGNILRSYHLDGRAGAEQFDSEF